MQGGIQSVPRSVPAAARPHRRKTALSQSHALSLTLPCTTCTMCHAGMPCRHAASVRDKKTINSLAAPAEGAQVPHERESGRNPLSRPYPRLLFPAMCRCASASASVLSARSKLQRCGGFGTRLTGPELLGHLEASPLAPHDLHTHSTHPLPPHDTTTDACASHQLLQYRPD